MHPIHLEAGTLTCSAADRTITGLLLPYGEVGNTNVGRVLVASGAVEIPQDLSILNLNAEHAQTEPRGRIATVTETPQGLVASFSVGQNPEGDALLASVEAAQGGTGTPPALSVELANVVIKAGRVIKAKLSGAAVVAKGAFPSASIFAADAGEAQAPAAPAPAPAAPAPAPARHVGQLVAAQAPMGIPSVKTEERGPKLEDFLAAACAAQLGDYSQLNELSQHSTSLFAALTDVKYDTAGSIGNAPRLPQWLGELWNGIETEREIIDLLGGTQPLTSLKFEGWRWTEKPTVARWDGNMANVPSTGGKTERYTGTAVRFAGGHNHSVEYEHFGETAVLAAFLKFLTESYRDQSEAYVLEELLSIATPVEVAAAPSHVPGAIGRVVRGTRFMRAAKAKAAFALVAEEDYEEILFTKSDDSLAYLSASFNLREGQTVEEVIRPRTELATGQTLLVARESVTPRELPGVPIRMSGVDVARGALSDAVFGYVGLQVDYPKGVQLTTTAE